MDLAEVLHDMNSFLKAELARRDVHIEQLQHQNVQLVNMLVGVPPEIVENPLDIINKPKAEDDFSDMLGGEISLAGTIARHQEAG